MTNCNISDEHWIDFLQTNSIIETKEEIIKRQKVLLLLQSTLRNFVRDVIKENDYKRTDLNCILLPFGSYGLGGYLRNADIDLVLICPWLVKRNAFNKFFPDNLKHLATIRDVEVIRQASVPIIKCTVDSISIDISFVRLRESKIDPGINLLDDSLLDDIDPVCVASMDGPRVNQFIKSQILSQHISIFQRCLQCVKYWANQRQIYSKPIGYLNGSSWTLLLVKAYQLIRNSSEDITISSLLKTFFETWRDWPWPAPVMLTGSIPGKHGARIEYQSLMEFEDAIMPIVSPCYPVCNTTPYVRKATLKIMSREFERACIILNGIQDDQVNPKEILKKLFNPVSYFKRYRHFITIVTSSSTNNSHEIWVRKMAHNISQLVSLIENSTELKLIQPVIKPKIIIKNYRTLQECKALQAGMSLEEAKVLDQTGTLCPGTIYLSYYLIGVQLEESCKFIDLSSEVNRFKASLESKRNKNDSDVQWAINVMTRAEVSNLLGGVKDF
ncbi:Poly(A) polymerase central domain-containing protein [Cokeromyces recurvatus]|uniref:Poly(A) polymerase central domain-containing protein n=1 Tax=Cokeromyces recurvatus TaxID=90255 RepID=UPI0022205855|nr:Poly(A) polymerase central domain-containing protein [Cokeromyces recurvatus]KAI7902857.1 Poly(A) polymerase central domain-containing protein [Cokeromyces recurvatus]